MIHIFVPSNSFLVHFYRTKTISIKNMYFGSYMGEKKGNKNIFMSWMWLKSCPYFAFFLNHAFWQNKIWCNTRFPEKNVNSTTENNIRYFCLFPYWISGTLCNLALYRGTRNSYLNTGSFPKNLIWIWGFMKKSISAYLKFDICIPKILYLHAMLVSRHIWIFVIVVYI